VATDSNGFKRDVTGLVRWTSGNSGIATVNRSGGLIVCGLGKTSISAELTSPALKAKRTVDTTILPVVGPVRTEAVSRDRALLSFTTASFGLITAVVVQEVGSPTLQVVFGRPDPAAKHHRFTVTGLEPATKYSVLPLAMNVLYQIGAGAAVVVVTK
jgi:hypothetical protein